MKKTLALIAITAAALCSCGAKNEPPTPPGEETVTIAAPTGVEIDGTAGADELAFRWNAVNGAESYGYRLLEGSSLKDSGTTTATSAKFGGLKEETIYRFEVKAVAGNAESVWSTRVEARTGKGTPSVHEPDPLGDVYGAMGLPDNAEARAFPGAEGGGMFTTGGRGGKVLHVTRLDDDKNEGSLRWAIEQKGARTIVFDVAGRIDLQSSLVIKNGDLTIAGQTAPGDGICISGNNVRINANNVIIRFMRFRMGDEHKTEDDALNCYTKEGLKNVIVDHCSLSWSTDECGSFYGVEDFTLQWCILSESLRISVHGKGAHGYGGIWGGKNASYHHNLLAHHDSRNPRFDHSYVTTVYGDIHYYNNVVYNWSDNSGYGGESGKDETPRRINMVNNYYKPGPASTNSSSRARIVNPTTKCSNCNKNDQYDIVPGLFYVKGNVMEGYEDVTADNSMGVHPDDKNKLSQVLSASYMGTMPSSLQSAADAYEAVLKFSGAALSRDRVDKRIVKETREGSYTYEGSATEHPKGKDLSRCGLIDSQKDVGGWPEYKASDEDALKAVDSDADGIPDYYETLLGLDRENPADAAEYTIDSKYRRYSNIEMYLHYLVRNIVNQSKQ